VLGHRLIVWSEVALNSVIAIAMVRRFLLAMEPKVLNVPSGADTGDPETRLLWAVDTRLSVLQEGHLSVSALAGRRAMLRKWLPSPFPHRAPVLQLCRRAW
jgi:hypothetical protein